MTVAHLGEFGLIDRIRGRALIRDARVLLGIGDDAAILAADGDRRTLVTIDTLIEGVHFRRSLNDPRLLGQKALAVNVSDIAAMGARPLFYLVALALPPATPLAWVDDIVEGMERVAEEWNLTLIGGDLSRSLQVMLTVTVIGEAEAADVVSRAGARPGDTIYVTGTLGDAALGWALLLEAMADRTGLTHWPDIEAALAERGEGGPEAVTLVRRHLAPTPRVREGQTLARGRVAHAMIDVSDGLVADLHHLCEASGVTARIHRDRVPRSAEFRRRAARAGARAWEWCLTGGEDYELLFAAPPETGVPPEVGATAIGQIVAGPPRVVVLDEEEHEVTLPHAGFDHFA